MTLIKKILWLLVILFVSSCTADNDRTAERVQMLTNVEKQRVTEFEESYLEKKCQYQTRSSAKSLKLVGYVTVAYHGEDSVFVNKLWEYYKKEISQDGSFLILDGKVRVYFPLRDAIVEVEDETIFSDSVGNVINHTCKEIDKLKIKGRQSTARSVFTEFEQSLQAEKKYADYNALVFDFGEKKLCCAMPIGTKRIKQRSESGSSNSNVSCVKNHGSNCTVAFHITSSNCVIRYDRCMDYNGYGTDCSGSHRYFVGSDCSKAMAMGHCWNETM